MTHTKAAVTGIAVPVDTLSNNDEDRSRSKCMFEALMRCDAVVIWPCLALLFVRATGHIENSWHAII
jgi:hypothetical protein